MVYVEEHCSSGEALKYWPNSAGTGAISSYSATPSRLNLKAVSVGIRRQETMALLISNLTRLPEDISFGRHQRLSEHDWTRRHVVYSTHSTAQITSRTVIFYGSNRVTVLLAFDDAVENTLRTSLGLYKLFI